MTPRFNMMDHVVTSLDNLPEIGGHIVGVFPPDDHRTEYHYVINGDPTLYPESRTRLMDMAIDFLVDFRPRKGVYQLRRIQGSMRKSLSQCEYISTFTLTDCMPEIKVSLYWTTIPGTIPQKLVRKHATSIARIMCRVSDRTN